ncbi:SAV_2336 N-terminal domain-related protein [Streptomyces sp. MK7]|uniref:SAV_2336 N-terminal domain-related protein n=1 Tax=Streptomyces sp. MK7 TaxID=3067635 RepID=UPI00292E1913|nr:SAV_2336 N-terminal domain-related protein [Streptomyces sp. MK7]
MIRQLAELLRRVGEEPDAEQLADALWLADHLGPSAAPAGFAGAAVTTAASEGPPGTAGRPPWDPEPAAPRTAPPTYQAGIGSNSPMALYLPEARPAPRSAEGQRIRLRAPAALPRRAALARSLRPLARRVPSRDVTVLDEEATVEGIVDTAQWSPVLRPAPSRWLDLVLVVDDSVSMALWRDTVREFLSVLSSVGAFRSVQHWVLPTEEIPSHGIVLRPPTARSGERLADRSPLEIVDPTGRRIVLVASDCVSPSWADGTLGRLLRTWGESSPVALVHLLPRRMWKRSALSVHEVRLGSDAPGVPNSGLRVTPLDGRLSDSHRLAARAMAVPVLDLHPDWLGQWAALVSGETSAWDTLATLVPESPAAVVSGPPPSPPTALVPTPPEDLVLAFVQHASPMARRLAVHVAAVPLSLPVMRLVQQAVCRDTRPSVLTEVLFTGLVTRADHDADDADASVHEVMPVPFDFRPGVREVLLGMARNTEILHTLSLVTEWLFDRLERSGTPTADFTALLGGEAPAVDVARSVRPFATVTAQALRRLSERYEALARQLEKPATAEAPGLPSDGTRSGDKASAGTPVVSGTVPPARTLLDRDELLTEVHASAFRGRDAGLVLTAREGGGATAVAVQYVALYGHAYDHVAWVTAGRPTAGPELPALLRATGRQPTATWLLVVDGARPEDLPAPLPDGPGTLLVTSADGDWPDGFTRWPVPPFKPATSIRFLLERVHHLAAPVALRIAARLDNVALALAMAAGLLSRLTPDALLTALGADPTPGALPAAPLDDPVAEVCALAQDHVERECPAATPLLELCAVLAEGPVPAGFFSWALPRTDGSALAALVDAALVTVADDGATLFVASAVGRVRRERMSPAEVAAAQRMARAAFIAWHAAVAPTARDSDGLLGLTRHLEAMGALGDDDPAVREAVRDQVRLLADRGDTKGALAWGSLALERLRAQVGADGPGTAELALLLTRTTAAMARDEEPHRP